MSSNLTHVEAADEIQTLFKTAWDAGSPSAGVELFWGGLDREPPQDVSWAEVFVTHVDAGQGSLTGGLGTTVFMRLGTVTISIRTVAGEGLKLNRQLGMVAVDAFEGKTTPGGVWFRNVRYSEAPGRDGKWQQGNVIAEFTYDQIK